MDIADIDKFSVDLAKNKLLTKFTTEKRILNKAKIDDFMSINNELRFEPEEMLCYGGFLSIPRNSSFLIDILIDKSECDILDSDSCIEFLSSNKGLIVQRARFRDLYLKPVNKWMRNRRLIDKELAIALVKHKVLGDFDELASFLDSRKVYSLVEIARWKALR